MARKTYRRLKQGMSITEDGGMLGKVYRRVLDVRPGARRKGRATEDEAVILVHRVYPSGRRSRGHVEVIETEKAYELFGAKKS